MTQCLRPECLAINQDHHNFCQRCGKPLWLKERYQALKLIGQGGFGKTFLAIDHDKPSKSRCVIKLFYPSSLGTENLEKASRLFRQEAQRLEELGKHKGIPELMAYFELDGKLYLVQEYIEGENLAECLSRDGSWTELEVKQLLVEVLEILSFVHGKKIIHRDIKPENIIRKVIEGGYQYILVDFGASSQITPESMMRTGTIIGDPRYMSDEQIQGKAIFSSDIYSLGVTCLHLLTNIEPWSLFDTSEGKWIWRDYLTQNINNHFAEIVDKMVAKASKYRLKTVEEVLGLLDFNGNKISEDNSDSEKLQPQLHENANIVNNYLKQIDSLLENEQYDNALYLCEIKLKENSNDELILHRKGRIFLCLNQPSEAISIFEKILSLNNTSIPDLYFYSYALHCIGNYDLALDIIKKAINISQNDINLYYGLAQIYFSQRKYRDAIGIYSKIIDMVPEENNAWYGKEVSSIYLSQNQDKIKIYEENPEGYFENLQRFQKDGKWGFRDSKNRVRVNPRFDEVLDFFGGVAGVRNGKYWQFINYEGHFISESKYKIIGNFSEGLAMVKSGEKFGYINRNGTIIIPIKFWSADTFVNGLAAVQTNTGFRYIDKNGDFWGDLCFEYATSFWEGVSTISINKKYGSINMEGDFVIEPQFIYLGCFSEGLAPFRNNHKKDIGFVDVNGNVVIPAQFYEVGYFEKGVSKVKYINWLIKSEGLINKHGNWTKRENKLNIDTICYSLLISLSSLASNGSISFSMLILLALLSTPILLILDKIKLN
jgi:serine/threonine protein kinase